MYFVAIKRFKVYSLHNVWLHLGNSMKLEEDWGENKMQLMGGCQAERFRTATSLTPLPTPFDSQVLCFLSCPNYSLCFGNPRW